MAGGKETPRQKMIGLMYLVLMALLAMNVSKDILESFVVLNDGLEQAQDIYEMKNKSLYTDFHLANSVNPEKVRPYFIQAEEVKSKSEEIVTFIDEVKKQLLIETDGLIPEIADTIHLSFINKKDDYDTPTRVMVGDAEDASLGRAREIKDKINSYKTELLAMLHNSENAKDHIALDMSDRPDSEGVIQNWEINTFDHAPVVAAITLLSELQNEIRDAEYFVVNELYKKVSDDQIPFDTVAAKVFAESNYVVLGDEYKATIFLAGFSKTQNPDIYIGELDTASGDIKMASDTLEVADGMAQYTLPAGKEGFFEYSGAIAMTLPSGEKKSFPFKSNYIVQKPNVVVSPTQMLVLYKGIDNPVAISVPGIADNLLQPSVNGGNQLIKQADGSYNVKVSPSSPYKTKISVSAKMSDGTIRPMGGVEFRVKNLPKPYAKIKDITTTGRMRKNRIILAQGIRAEFDKNFNYNLPIRVKSFTLSTYRSGKWTPFISPNNRWTEDMKGLINSARSGDKMYFTDIKARTPDGVMHEMSPIVIEIF